MFDVSGTTKRRKGPIIALVVVVLLLASGWYFYRQSMYSVIDDGIDLVTYATEDAGTILSPEGTSKLYLTFHDAGATHSGNFWTWITIKSRITGRKVVAQGYSSYPVRYQQEKFPITWIDEKTFQVTFVQQRSNDPHTLIVKLD